MTNSFLAGLLRHLSHPTWNRTVSVVFAVLMLICVSGTHYALAENIVLKKMVQVTPKGECGTYCDKEEGDCTPRTCNFTCPSGITTPPRPTPLTGVERCGSLSDPRISDSPLNQSTHIYAFSNDSSTCTFSRNLSSMESLTVAFWVKISTDLRCNTEEPACSVFWIPDQKNTTRDILKVQASPNQLHVDIDGGSLDLALESTGWQHITILASKELLLGVVDVDLETVNAKTPGPKIATEVETIWGLKAGESISKGIFAVAGIKLYQRAVDGREIKRLQNIDDIPRVDPECRCGFPTPIESDPLHCKGLKSGVGVSRVNLQAHYIEYVNDGDVKTVWVSDPRSSSNITIDLGGRNQIFNMTIKFGTSRPQTVGIERVFGNTTKYDSRESGAEADFVISWDVDLNTANRSLYEKTLVTEVKLVLQGHANGRNYHSVAEIIIFGRRACYGSQENGDSCICEAFRNTTSHYCHDCKKEFFHNGSLTCSSCNCNNIGSKGACDQVTGQCVCEEDKHMTGIRCDRCKNFYYNLTSAGCQDCGCDRTRTRGCNPDSGRCHCNDNVEGANCDKCKEGHYWTVNKTGCVPCGCHPAGRNSPSCRVDDGKCECKPNYEGRDCSRCMSGYWSFPVCKACPKCSVLGTVPTMKTCNATSGRCSCVGGVMENYDCAAIIKGVVPTFGPVAGGTRVTIAGQLLGEGANFTVYLNDRQQISHSRKHTSLVFETRSSNTTGKVEIRVDLGQGVTHSLNLTRFEYRVNPTVSSITPSVSISSGGILLRVTGSNLDSVYQPVLRAYNSSHVLQATQECLVRIRSSTLMYCPSPSLSWSQDPGQNYFLLGVQFDAFSDYLLLPESAANLTVYKNPIINPWNSTRDFTYPFNQVINITGFNLTVAVRQSDYSVTVGNKTCAISQMSQNQIICLPPSSVPADPQVNATDTVNVTVKVGFLEVTVGQLHYIPFYKSKEFIGIMVGIGGLFLLILLVIVVRRCRKGRQHDQPSVPGYSLGRHGSGGSYIHPIPERPALPPLPNSASLFDRLEDDIQNKVMEAKVDKQYFKPGKFCTKKGELARIIDGQFTNQSPVLPGGKLTIKAFVKAVPVNAAVPPWATQAILQAVSFRGHKHPSILELLGVGFDKTRAYFLYRHMSNRSLKEYIINPQIDIKNNELMEYALQIAEGMEFLSSRDLQHKDLATRNCMVDDDFITKICDTAFASDLHSSEYVYDSTRDMYRPLRWMALEYMKDGFHTTKSDVWSYGIVVWELFNRGLLPYHDMADDEIQRKLEERYRPQRPPQISDNMDELMMSCWDEDPNQRPSFSEIVRRINEEVGIGGTVADFTGDYVNMDPQSGLGRGRDRASSFYQSRPESKVHGNVPVDHNTGRSSVRRY